MMHHCSSNIIFIYYYYFMSDFMQKDVLIVINELWNEISIGQELKFEKLKSS